MFDLKYVRKKIRTFHEYSVESYVIKCVYAEKYRTLAHLLVEMHITAGDV